MLSLACQEGVHAMCMRRSCGCRCGHPGRLSSAERERLLTQRPRRRAPSPERAVPIRARMVLPVSEIVEQYRGGDGLKVLAARYGVGVETVRRRLLDAGVTLRRQGDRSKPLPMDEIIAAYESGESCALIAARHGVDETTILRRLRALGIALRGNERREVDWAEIAEQYLAGVGATTLAAMYDVGETTVLSRLRRMGIEIRRPGRMKGAA